MSATARESKTRFPPLTHRPFPLDGSLRELLRSSAPTTPPARAKLESPASCVLPSPLSPRNSSLLEKIAADAVAVREKWSQTGKTYRPAGRSSVGPVRRWLAAISLGALLASNAPRCFAQESPYPPYSSSLRDSAPDATTESGETAVESPATEDKQSKRILGVFPNYRAVSADTSLPPLSLREKLWLATQDSFDYSSFITASLQAGISQAKNSYPEFGHHSAAYGRYYWHSVADQAVGNYMTEAIFPAITREDPRYYTLGHGGFLKRSEYALSRLLITRTDSGGRSFNFSEILGNGAGAAISNTYYPSRERTWTKTGQKWVAQIGLDGAFNILKEFWPDINRKVFHNRY